MIDPSMRPSRTSPRTVRSIGARALASITLAIVAVAAPATRALGQDASARLSHDPSELLAGEVLRAATAIPDERTPEADEHYPTSNEWRHDLWFPHVRDLGGAFVGVGSDQCYTLAAVQDARMVWLVDFDPLVPAVHRMYEELVALSPTPEALVARFSPERADETRALLEERLAADPIRARVLRIFDLQRQRWPRYLSRVSRLSRDGAPTSWLSDPVLYARVRTLFASGRIVARIGDLTGEQTLRAIGAAARALGVPVRVLYTSNAEQFFPYGEAFVANLRALPRDQRSVVLRTFRDPDATYPPGDRWHYVVHAWADFADRLEHGGYRHSAQIASELVHPRRPVQGAGGLTIIDESTRRRRRGRTRAPDAD
ncbi:MAG: hypothetical protein M3Y87_05410 [Myxococcota bacterium]|nr:hypothetical protein [Myxococcota bacterium]